MSEIGPHRLYSALEDFRRARRNAAFEQIAARLLGKSAELLSFDEVRQKLRATGSTPRGLQDIPLAAIVGSVGRYTDFTRSFLPRRESDRERWARVQLAITDLGSFPPIEVYQIGQVYFVVDGNHRVSIARRFGSETIQAYVTEIATKVPMSPDDEPDELILKAEYAGFLERSSLDETRPDADLHVTLPGRYPEFEEQIAVHRYQLEQARGEAVREEEAAADWYDTRYLPAVAAIREQGILRDFPGRTEADLYIWISRHRATLREALGWEVAPGSAALDLVSQHSPTPQRVAARLGEKLRGALTPSELVEGPGAGQWRRERGVTEQAEGLFADLLVPVSGEAVGWHALDQALVVAQQEQSRLLGLHVVPTTQQQGSKETRAVQEAFLQRCAAAGVRGQLVLEVADSVAPLICERARWADLVVVNLAHPPSSRPLARVRSGFRTLVRRSPRPILATPATASPLRHALLAYDGSPKGHEALFIATYLAEHWGIALHVLTVGEGEAEPGALREARRYLEGHGVRAAYLHGHGPVAEAVLREAERHQCDFLIMGGYGFGPMREVVLGSAVDQVLRESRHPTLLCR